MSSKNKQSTVVGKGESSQLTPSEQFEFVVNQLNDPSRPVLERFSRIVSSDPSKIGFVATQLVGLSVHSRDPVLGDYARTLLEVKRSNELIHKELGTPALSDVNRDLQPV